MIRFSPMLDSLSLLPFIIVTAGLYTSLYAGLNALVEKDLKKLVALSTLSHLGFICVALFRGSLYLAFLHLIAHALFKSLLFMSVGEIILLSHHSQDKRIITSSLLTTSHSSMFMVFSFANLVGLPFVGGFYSKDNILEILLNSFTSNFLVFVIYLNVFLTFIYTLNIFMSVFSFSNAISYNIVIYRSVDASIFMGVLGLFRVFVACLFFWVSPIACVYYASILTKCQPLLILRAALIVRFFFCKNPKILFTVS